METFSFIDIITGKAIPGVNQIVIPKIQRDYAQGRKTQHASDIRELFSSSLIATLKSSDKTIQPLDFIYGYIQEDAFLPLDGQQRLTTLFLLHWLVLPFERRNILVTEKDNGSVLSYCTRPSAKDFCKFLVGIDIKSLSERFDKAVKDASDNDKEIPQISAFIHELDEYRYNWDFDPTVLSMLRMLDTFMSKFGTFEEIAKLDHTNLDNIRFHNQKLQDLRNGDDLYVKMNARGLELSDFDNTKSTLESDMILAGVKEDIQKEWREKMDGNWIDFFWHRAGADRPGAEPQLGQIRKIEDDLKTFILRLKDLRWFAKYLGNTTNVFEENILGLLSPNNAARNLLSGNLMTYVAMRFEDTHSSFPGMSPVIDYSYIIDNFNNFIFEKDGKWLPADALVNNVVFPKDDNNNPQDITEIIIGNEFTYNNRVFLYGLFKFLKEFPASIIKIDEKLLSDFNTWLRVLRNLTLARNGHRFDDPKEVVRAKEGIEAFINDFIQKNHKLRETGRSLSMSDHIIDTPTIDGLDSFILEEEKQKEKLRKNKDWGETLDKYENEGYLFGQLSAPLQWSAYDKENFIIYADFLNRLMSEDYSGYYLYAALLLTTEPDKHNYPFIDSFLLFNYTRDWSFKRYLRESFKGTLAPALLNLAKIWEKRYTSSLSISDFLNEVIGINKENLLLPLWKAQLAEFPELIYEYTGSNLRGIDRNKSYGYFIAQKRKDKEWNINLCWLKKTKYKDDRYVLHHTKEESKFRDTITYGDRIVATGEYGDLYPVKIPHRSKFLPRRKGAKHISYLAKR